MPYLYQDSSQPIEKRVADLLSRMSLEEKIGQMSVRNGSAEPPEQAARVNNATQKKEIENSRWGIPILLSRETSHGMNNLHVTSFPACIVMASTWDEDLVYRIGRVIAAEAIAQGIRQGLSPLIDICRDPRYGRMEEGLGEDVLLTGRMGVAFIKGLQGNDLKNGIIATPKHLVGYGASEGGKDNDPISITERDLREVYLPPFEMAIKQADTQSIMICFGAVNGIPCTSDKSLVTDLLDEWGFDGFVIDDCPGLAGLVGHKAAGDIKEAIALGINAGIDRQFFDFCGMVPGQAEGQEKFEKLLLELVREGKVSEERINQACAKVLRAKFRLGLFENPYGDEKNSVAVAKRPEHRLLTREVAVKGMVLLKNNGVLPLTSSPCTQGEGRGGGSSSAFSVQHSAFGNDPHPAPPPEYKGREKSGYTIAVIGPNADVGQLGDYTGTPEHVVTPLEGIRAAVGTQAEIIYEKGCEILPTEQVAGRFSVKFYGNLRVDVAAEYTIELESNDGVRLQLDNKAIIDDWAVGPRRKRSVKLSLSQGNHPIHLTYFRGVRGLVTEGDEDSVNRNVLRLRWSRDVGAVSTMPDDVFSHESQLGIQQEGSGEGLWMEVFLGENFATPLPEQKRVAKDVNFDWGVGSPIIARAAQDVEKDSIARAVAVAKRADVAIVCVGETSARGAQQVCGEHFDRADIGLTGSQAQLVRAIAATGKPMVLVLINGRSLAIPDLIDASTSVLEAWYPGQEGGHAIADILFGKANPSGKLPVSIPRSAGQLPIYYDRRPRMGYYIDEKSEPLFPFGFGLSYTKFEYSELQISPAKGDADTKFVAEVEIVNAGDLPGDEIVQIYIEDAICTFVTPVKRLADFARVSLRAGEKRTVRFEINRKMLERLDQQFQPRVEPGEFKIQIGGSSVHGLTSSLWIEK
ncbi:MAG TPA: glycoside hydrolase family 3 N-terminal domain-containing protein [Tepidisphaeraceae bacterium]|jgi:beta-glucosidase